MSGILNTLPNSTPIPTNVSTLDEWCDSDYYTFEVRFNPESRHRFLRYDDPIDRVATPSTQLSSSVLRNPDVWWTPDADPPQSPLRRKRPYSDVEEDEYNEGFDVEEGEEDGESFHIEESKNVGESQDVEEEEGSDLCGAPGSYGVHNNAWEPPRAGDEKSPHARIQGLVLRPNRHVRCNIDHCSTWLSLENVKVALSHWRAHHPGEGNNKQKFRCRVPGCISEPLVRTELERHYVLVHLNVWWGCHICVYETNRFDLMQNHLETHHNIVLVQRRPKRARHR